MHVLFLQYTNTYCLRKSDSQHATNTFMWTSALTMYCPGFNSNYSVYSKLCFGMKNKAAKNMSERLSKLLKCYVLHICSMDGLTQYVDEAVSHMDKISCAKICLNLLFYHC